MTRKLASIRRISEINPIDGADKIEVAHVDGWNVIVKKDEFKPGDIGVYFEIDSLLPEKEVFEFLRKSSYTKKSQNGSGFRLKTIKLRGQISQGLLLPTSSFNLPSNLEVGDDVTTILEVQKYEPIIPLQLAGKIRGNFPIGIPKTDQERIQNLFGKLDYNRRINDTYEVTLKLDGTSFTCYQMEEHFGVCSRNLDLEETEDNLYWKIANKYNLKEKFAEFGYKNIAIQGEIMGPGVQNNRENLDDHVLFVFDIWDIKSQKYLEPSHRYEVCGYLGLRHIPIIEKKFTLLKSFKTVQEILDWADNTKSINNEISEGLVFKSIQNTWFSFKAISNKFLLSTKD